MNAPVAAMLGAVLSIAASVAWAAETDPAMKQAAGKIAVEVCSTCHRPHGDRNPPGVPTLMGQQKAYLAWQLRAYGLQFRDDPQAYHRVWNSAGRIDDRIIAALAEYYASQPATPGTPGDAALIATGRQLYATGIPSRNITGCASCHAGNGEGNGIFPRLAGQSANYLVRQISMIQEQVRNVGIMHSTVQGLSSDEVRAVAIFLQAK